MLGFSKSMDAVPTGRVRLLSKYALILHVIPYKFSQVGQNRKVEKAKQSEVNLIRAPPGTQTANGFLEISLNLVKSSTPVNLLISISLVLFHFSSHDGHHGAFRLDFWMKRRYSEADEAF